MKSKQDRKLETLEALIVEVYGTSSQLVQREGAEFSGYYATCHEPDLPHGYYLGATLENALEGAARAATELLKQERIRRELHNATATINSGGGTNSRTGRPAQG